MTAYRVSEIVEINNPAAVPVYRKQVHKLVEKFGGSLTGSGPSQTVAAFSMSLVLEFQNRESADAWFHSPEYCEFRDLRRKAAGHNSSGPGVSVGSGSRVDRPLR